MITYVKIFLEGKKRPVILKNPVEVGIFLMGIEVHKDGEEVFHPGGRFDQRQHLIEKTMIKKMIPMRMNKHYGWLEEER